MAALSAKQGLVLRNFCYKTITFPGPTPDFASNNFPRSDPRFRQISGHGPRLFDWAGIRARTCFQAARARQSLAQKSLDKCLVQNSSATRWKPKSESAGFKDQSLFKEQKDSIFFVRGTITPLTNGGLISVMCMFFYSSNSMLVIFAETAPSFHSLGTESAL
jgi:hypothetical protein